MRLNRGSPSRFPLWALWLAGAATLLAAALLIFALVLGVRAGQQQLDLQTRQQVGIHLQKAIDYRTEGNLEAALSEYQRVLILDPGNMAAVEGIEGLLQVAAGGEPPNAAVPAPAAAAAPSPAPVSPLPAPTVTVDALAAAWQAVETAYAQGRWQEAVDGLLAIQSAEPTHETERALDMLYNAYLNLAAEKDKANRLEEALGYVDKALALRPDSATLRLAREQAAQYLDALNVFGVDWGRAVAVLSELHAADPTYRDVEERLQEAHIAYGDVLALQGSWCEAEQEYIAAIEINVTSGLIEKRDEARSECDGAPAAVAARATPLRPRPTSTDGTLLTPVAEATTAVETPTPLPAPARAPAAAGAPSGGHILFAMRSPIDGRSRIFTQAVSSGAKAQPLVEDGTQPAMRGDGQRVVYYNTRADMAGISASDPASGLVLRFTTFAEDRLPDWNPEGNRIVFASNREGDRRWRIYVAWAETNGGVTNLGYGETPAWDPTGDRIAYRGCDASGNGCGLWMMTSSGANQLPLTGVPGDTHPTWAPDGRFVVFMSDGRHGNFELYRLDLDTKEVVRLTDNAASDGLPAVSPDGAWVAFLSNRSGGWGLWAVPAAGGEEVQLASLDGEVGNWLEQNIQWID